MLGCACLAVSAPGCTRQACAARSVSELCVPHADSEEDSALSTLLSGARYIYLQNHVTSFKPGGQHAVRRRRRWYRRDRAGGTACLVRGDAWRCAVGLAATLDWLPRGRCGVCHLNARAPLRVERGCTSGRRRQRHRTCRGISRTRISSRRTASPALRRARGRSALAAAMALAAQCMAAYHTGWRSTSISTEGGIRKAERPPRWRGVTVTSGYFETPKYLPFCGRWRTGGLPASCCLPLLGASMRRSKFRGW